MTTSETAYVLDAHALWWYWTDLRRLGQAARAAFEQIEQRHSIGLVPAIVVAEIHHLSRRIQRARSVEEILVAIDRSGALRVEPITRGHLLYFGRLGEIPDMHDRLIGAVALMYNATLISRDSILSNVTAIRTVW